jgi:RNA-binding protein
MITSKQRAELRAQANGLDTILMVGKGGVTENLIKEAENCLDARELVKGKVLETALMSAREVSDAICEATGADGIQCVGTKFVIYRYNPKLHQGGGTAVAKKKRNPVKEGAKARKAVAKAERERRNAYFKEAAQKAAREKRAARDDRD